MGPLQTNAYLVVDRELQQAVLVDAVEAAPVLTSGWDGWQWQAILQTHTHFDHVGGLVLLSRQYEAPVYIHEAEASWVAGLIEADETSGISASGAVNAVSGEGAVYRPDHTLKGGEQLELLGRTWHVLHTPGHSPGGVSFWLPSENAVFVGDALFAGSIGRTDLEGGDHVALLSNIQKKLFSLPDETIVYPGHGPETSIGHEKKYNPFFT